MRTLLRSSSEDRPDEAAIRERRIEVARRNFEWTELRETDLVRRGRYLIHAESDELFTAYRGVVFQTGSATLIADRFPMYWFLDRDGELVFLERSGGTWSSVVERRAKRGGAPA